MTGAMHPILQTFHDTGLGALLRDIPWMFGAFESAHFVGLCLLMGAMLIVDLRLLGLFRAMALRHVLAFTHLAAAGLAINAFTGLGFFCFEPDKYWPNPAFRLKLMLVGAALLNILWFEVALRRRAAAVAPDLDTSRGMKAAGALSLTLWFAILLVGRMMPIWEPVF